MKFSKVLPLLFDDLKRQGVDFALIGGVALHAHGIDRTTFDADFLIFVSDTDTVDRLMRAHGYHRAHASETFANYLSKDFDMGRVDFMYASKHHSRAMLGRAEKTWIMGYEVKVLRVEDMIGLKVLSTTNDPTRATKDMGDIEDLMRRHHRKMNWPFVREYFKLFDREDEFKKLKKKTS